MTFVLQDTATMLRRNLLHARRYPSLTLLVAAIPVIFYLIFVFVFGSTLGDGLPGAVGGRDEYIAYLTPGILILTVANGISSMAIVIAMDKHEGIVLRFRTMSIPRAAVLAGHVVNGVLQTMFSIVLVIGVAVLTGFRPTTSPLEIAGAIGMLAVASFAFSWLAVPMGLVSNSVETASNLPLPILLLPFFGSAFVPPESMPWPISWFAEYQPFTPMIETVRGLLLGTPIGWNGVIALGWCARHHRGRESGARCASTTGTPSRAERRSGPAAEPLLRVRGEPSVTGGSPVFSPAGDASVHRVLQHPAWRHSFGTTASAPASSTASSNEWRAHLAPLRRAMGFEIPAAWTVPEEDRFIWLLEHPGDWDAFAEADAAYFASPERAAIDPDPARLIEEQRTLRLTDVSLP